MGYKDTVPGTWYPYVQISPSLWYSYQEILGDLCSHWAGFGDLLKITVGHEKKRTEGHGPTCRAESCFHTVRFTIHVHSASTLQLLDISSIEYCIIRNYSNYTSGYSYIMRVNEKMPRPFAKQNCVWSGQCVVSRFGDVEYGPMDEFTQIKIIVDGKDDRRFCGHHNLSGSRCLSMIFMSKMIPSGGGWWWDNHLKGDPFQNHWCYSCGPWGEHVPMGICSNDRNRPAHVALAVAKQRFLMINQ